MKRGYGYRATCRQILYVDLLHRLSMHWRGKYAIQKMQTFVNWYFVSPGYRTLATVLSSFQNTATDRMRACMKIHKTRFLLYHGRTKICMIQRLITHNR